MFRSSGSSSGPPSLPQLPRQSLISSSITSSQSPAQSNSAPRANFPSLSPRLKWALILGVPIAAVGLGLAFYFATRRSRTAGTIRDGAGAPKAKPTVPAVNEPPRKKEKVPETALEKAIAIKEQGNKLYKSGNYDKAIESYSAAAEKLLRRSQLLQAVIEKRPLPEAEPLSDGDSPPPSVEAARTEFGKLNIELSTYYQNRAASYDALGDLDAVVKDCTLSLSHQKHYQKAISRRARAHERLAMKLVPRLDEGGCGKTPPATIREALVHLREAFEDLTATCILEAFSSADTLLSCDRVLRLLALLRAQYIIATEQEKGSAAGVRADEDIEFLIARQFSLPSSSTIRSFFTPFEHDPVVLQSRALPNAASLTSSLSEAAQLPAAPMDMSTSFELLGGDSQQVRTLKTAIHKYDRMLRAFADQSFEQAETLCHELLDSLANVDLLQLDRDHAAYIREQRQQQQQQQTPPAPPVESAVGDTADGSNKSSEAVDEPQLRTVPDETEEKAKQSAAAPAPASPTNYTQLRSAQAMYACALSLRAAMRMLRNELTTAQADVQDGLSRVARFELQAVEGEAAAAKEKEKEVWEKLRRDLRSCLLIKRAAIAVQKQEMQAALKDFDEAVAIDPTV